MSVTVSALKGVEMSVEQKEVNAVEISVQVEGKFKCHSNKSKYKNRRIV